MVYNRVRVEGVMGGELRRCRVCHIRADETGYMLVVRDGGQVMVCPYRVGKAGGVVRLDLVALDGLLGALQQVRKEAEAWSKGSR